jgi:transcriptional regulator with XRE-family HTH domain
MADEQMVTTGRASAAGQVSTPDVRAAAGREGFKVELDGLRERMRGLGFGYDEIAAEVARRYRLRPREAYRLAWGWSLNHAAARFNALAARESTGPQAPAGMTGPHLGEHERWPDGGRKPPVSVLVLLAQIYQTDVLALLDLADHENLASADQRTLIRRLPPRGATPFADKLAALMQARGFSLTETARRVPCSKGYLSNLVRGLRGASEQMAGRLDEVLEAGGELATLADTAEATAREHERPGTGNRRALPADARAAVTEGMSLSLPYVPGRLVIEVSGPAAHAGQLADDVPRPEIVTGRLALVPDTASAGTARTEVTGR